MLALPTVLTNRVYTFRVFQNYELQMRDLQADRSYLADGFGEFLFNNDEYIWSPLETYYKKRLLYVPFPFTSVPSILF